MQLLLDGAVHRVAQLGPDFLMLETSFDHPPMEADFVFAVDDNRRQWRVLLPDGISRNSARVRLVSEQAASMPTQAVG